MTVKDLVKKIVGANERKATTALDTYRAMVRDFAFGTEKVKPPEASRILEAANIAPARFELDVSEQAEVIQLEAVVASEAANNRKFTLTWDAIEKFEADELLRLKQVAEERQTVRAKHSESATQKNVNRVGTAPIGGASFAKVKHDQPNGRRSATGKSKASASLHHAHIRYAKVARGSDGTTEGSFDSP